MGFFAKIHFFDDTDKQKPHFFDDTIVEILHFFDDTTEETSPQFCMYQHKKRLALPCYIQGRYQPMYQYNKPI